MRKCIELTYTNQDNPSRTMFTGNQGLKKYLTCMRSQLTTDVIRHSALSSLQLLVQSHYEIVCAESLFL